MIRVFGLDQHLALQLGPPGPPRHLHQLGEQAFRRPPVGGEQRGIGAQHADQRQFGEIVALGQHLRADQDVRLAAMDAFEHRFPLLAAFDRVTVHTQDARLREPRLQPYFKALRAAAEGMNILVAASRAGFRHAALESAVMAAQAAIGQVEDEIGGAALAARHPAAGRAGQHRRIAAAI